MDCFEKSDGRVFVDAIHLSFSRRRSTVVHLQIIRRQTFLHQDGGAMAQRRSETKLIPKVHWQDPSVPCIWIWIRDKLLLYLDDAAPHRIQDRNRIQFDRTARDTASPLQRLHTSSTDFKFDKTRYNTRSRPRGVENAADKKSAIIW